MSRLSADFIREARKPTSKWAFLCSLHFDSGTLGFTSLVRNINHGGQTYIGFGNLGKVSDLKENSKLDSANYSVELSGVNTALMQAVLNENYLGRPAKCLLVLLDENDQILYEPLVYFKGKMDLLSCEHGATGRITVSIRDNLADWARPRIERYTDQEQQSRYPGDRGFEYVTSIASKEIVWPASSFYD